MNAEDFSLFMQKDSIRRFESICRTYRLEKKAGRKPAVSLTDIGREFGLEEDEIKRTTIRVWSRIKGGGLTSAAFRRTFEYKEAA